jgi:UDP-galactose transporter B1
MEMEKTPVGRISRIRAYVKISLDWFPVEVRFLTSVAGLYASFLYWGYLQEKITSTSYATSTSFNTTTAAGSPTEMKWDYSLALNLCMAVSAVLGAGLLERITGTYKQASIWLFWEMAITCSLASPIGYFSLKFIPYPLMVLAKSSKQVPVMLMGLLVFYQSYPWYKYVSVFFICSGVAMYTLCKTKAPGGGDDGHHGHSHENNEYSYIPESLRLALGIVLVLTNLLLDGYTNNKQDHVFTKEGVSSLAMMKYLNMWQAAFLALSLIVPYFYFMIAYGADSGRSELEQAFQMIVACPEIRKDILQFCLCATIGQVLIFVVMQEFGSLVWITVGVTRKLITIVMSIVVFKHEVNFLQWVGIAAVFFGLALESAMSYKKKAKHHHSPRNSRSRSRSGNRSGSRSRSRSNSPGVNVDAMELPPAAASQSPHDSPKHSPKHSSSNPTSPKHQNGTAAAAAGGSSSSGNNNNGSVHKRKSSKKQK